MYKQTNLSLSELANLRSSRDIGITLKANQIKLWNSIINNPMLEVKIEVKIKKQIQVNPG
jgi:hypothetical protein